METDKKIFVYSFSVWPDESFDHDIAMFDLFRVLGTRVDITFAEYEFLSFKHGLKKAGITLREVERIPALHCSAMLEST